jgi:hypothetical protein
MSTPKILDGWRELRDGEIIRRGDKNWIWNAGPWTDWNDYEQVYRPATKYDSAQGPTHWPVIRSKAALPVAPTTGKKE